MESTCFVMKLKQDKISGYIDIHKKGKTWPEVLNNIKNADIEKMKIYLLDDYAIVYMEADDIKKSFKYLGDQSSQIKWNEATSEFMETQPDYDSKEVVKKLKCVFDFEEGEQKETLSFD